MLPRASGPPKLFVPLGLVVEETKAEAESKAPPAPKPAEKPTKEPLISEVLKPPTPPPKELTVPQRKADVEMPSVAAEPTTPTPPP